MTDDQAFLDILNQNPADDTARLVYADWLDDRNEAVKAAYLRRVVDLVRLTPGSGEYSDAAAGLFTVAGQIDASWRGVAGGRFEPGSAQGAGETSSIERLRRLKTCRTGDSSSAGGGRSVRNSKTVSPGANRTGSIATSRSSLGRSRSLRSRTWSIRISTRRASLDRSPNFSTAPSGTGWGFRRVTALGAFADRPLHRQYSR